MRHALVGLSLGLLLGVPAAASAQAPGDRTETIHPILFQVLNDNIALDPTANVAPASRIEFTRDLDNSRIRNPDLGLDLLVGILEQVGVDIPGWLVDLLDGIGDFSSVDISASLGPFFDAKYGGYFQVQPASRAGLDLKAPVNITTNVPAMNSFKCGDEIAVLTGSQFGTSSSLTVQPSFYDFQLGPVFKDIQFGVQVGVDIDLCIGLDIPEIGCAGYRTGFHPPRQRIGTSIPLPSFLDPMPPLIDVCQAAFRPGANEADLLGCSAGPVKPLFDHWQRSLDALNSVPGAHFSFAEFGPGQVKLITPDLPSPLSFTIPEVEALFQQPGPVRAVGAAADGTITAAATQSDLSSASLDLISLLEYAGVPTALSLGAGLGSIDIGDVAPTFHIDQNMRYEFKPALSMSMSLGAPMPFRVIDPVAGQVATGTGAIVDFKPGQTVMLSFPPALRAPVAVTNTYSMSGTMNTRTSHQYRLSVKFKALKLAGPGFSFTALDEEVDLSGSVLPEHVIENHLLNLPAFPPVTLPGLTLDPEDPRIDVTEHSVRDTLNLGGGERAVVYRTSVANAGDVNLLNAGLSLDLARIFGTAPAFQTVCVASPDLALNQSYDGRTATGLLAPGTTLVPGQQGTVDVLVRVVPEVARVNGGGCFTPVSYTSSSFANGVSPIGTLVHNNLNQCTGERTAADILTTVNLGASVITKVADFAIYGSDSVVFDGASGVSYGNVGTGNNFHFKKSGDAEPVRIVGDMHAGHDLHIEQSKVLADYVQVHDNVHVDKKSALLVNGAVSEDSDCNTAFELPSIFFQRSSAASPKVAVADGAAVTLNPGDYRSIQIRNRGTVTLRAGVYNIDDLVIAGDGVTFAFDVSAGTITLNIDSWKNGNTRGLRFMVPAGATRAVRINYSGSGDLAFSNAVLQGTLVAPDAGLRLEDGTQMLGSARARRVLIGAGARFVDHHHLEPLKIDAACANALQAPNQPIIVGR